MWQHSDVSYQWEKKSNKNNSHNFKSNKLEANKTSIHWAANLQTSDAWLHSDTEVPKYNQLETLRLIIFWYLLMIRWVLLFKHTNKQTTSFQALLLIRWKAIFAPRRAVAVVTNQTGYFFTISDKQCHFNCCLTLDLTLFNPITSVITAAKITLVNSCFNRAKTLHFTCTSG